LALQRTRVSERLVLEFPVAPSQLWETLVIRTSDWWPREAFTSERTRRFVLEPHVGGRAFEDFGDGQGILWFSVVGLETGHRLQLAGTLLPPRGGPSLISLLLLVEGRPAGASALAIDDERFGIPGVDPPEPCLRSIFERGLRRHLDWRTVPRPSGRARTA
jgi:hypothetical protein